VDEKAFLRAICATPDDMTPRLAFADWLDEHNHGVRAAFIRENIVDGLVYEVQGGRGFSLLVPPTRPRPLPANGDTVIRGDVVVVVEHPPEGCYSYAVSRGFPERATYATGDWLRAGDEAIAECPLRVVILLNWRFSPLNVAWHHDPATLESTVRCRVGNFEGACVMLTRDYRDAADTSRPDPILAVERRAVHEAMSRRWPGITFRLHD
jgi:uncharacterized protein (TIGR02996 family)